MALTQGEYCPTVCPVCEAPGGGFVPCLRTRGPLEIRRCRVCSHLILSVWPPRSSDCPDEFGGIDLDAYIQSMEPERRRGAKTIFTMLRKWKPSAGEFFDVGASFGWLVEEGVNSGWKGSGVDPSAKAVAEAQRRGLDVMLGFFPRDAPLGKKWDVVTITDVVEHLEDPRGIIRDVRERLKEDGILVVQSPDVTGLLHRTAALLSAVTLGRMNGPLARLWQVLFHILTSTASPGETLAGCWKHADLKSWTRSPSPLSPGIWPNAPATPGLPGVSTLFPGFMALESESSTPSPR